MTDASAETFAKPTPALAGSASSAVTQSISARPPVAEITPLKAYDLANDEDPAGAGFLKLIRAHHATGRRKVEKLAVSMQALAAVKTSTEFVALQRKLLTEAIADAVSDSEAIGKLTTDAFSAAFNPMRKKIGDLRADAKRQE